MLSRVEKESKEAISAACFKELQSCGLLKNYSLFEAKYAGCLEGVKLKGASKNGEPKTTHTKKFRVFNKNRNTELTEFVALSALQACGIPTPKAKIKQVNDCTFYQFARDIAECHKASSDSSPVFHTLSELSVSKGVFQLSKDKRSVECYAENGAAKKTIGIDKNSIAKMLIAAIIFNLVDLHDENLGLIIDTKAGTAKLAVVDLQLRVTGGDRPEYTKHTALSSLIKSYDPIPKDFNGSFLKQLNEDDLLKALDELTTSMKNARQAAKQAVVKCKLTSWLEDDYIDTLLNSWQTNHDELQLFTLLNRPPQASCKK